MRLSDFGEDQLGQLRPAFSTRRPVESPAGSIRPRRFSGFSTRIVRERALSRARG